MLTKKVGQSVANLAQSLALLVPATRVDQGSGLEAEDGDCALGVPTVRLVDPGQHVLPGQLPVVDFATVRGVPFTGGQRAQRAGTGRKKINF